MAAVRFVRSRQMWTNENRGRYDRSNLRYPNDLTDEEWSIIGPLIPPAKRGGNRRHVVVREVINGLMYILSTGCQWRAIPKGLPPPSTLFAFFYLWGVDAPRAHTHPPLFSQSPPPPPPLATPTSPL